MRKLTLASAVAAVVLAVSLAPAAEAKTCIKKAGQGTNSTEEGAKFQAWEAVLQATDWGMWSQFMATSQKVGVAPGYTVSNLRAKCGKGGIGSECIVQATLCK